MREPRQTPHIAQTAQRAVIVRTMIAAILLAAFIAFAGKLVQMAVAEPVAKLAATSSAE